MHLICNYSFELTLEYLLSPPTFSGTLSGLSKLFYNKVSLRPNWQFPKMKRKMKSKEEGRKVTLPIGSVLWACVSLWSCWLKSYQWEREHQVRREKADAWEINHFLLLEFQMRTGNPRHQTCSRSWRLPWDFSTQLSGHTKACNTQTSVCYRPAAENCWQLAG